MRQSQPALPTVPSTIMHACARMPVGRSSGRASISAPRSSEPRCPLVELSGVMLLSRLSSASLASATRIAARSVQPQRTLFPTQHRTLRAANVSTWPVLQPRNIPASKLYRSLFASSVRRMTSSSSDTTSDGDDDNGATSHTHHASKADGDDASAQDHSDQVQVTINTSLHDAKQNHRWKYRRPYTPGDVSKT